MMLVNAAMKLLGLAHPQAYAVWVVSRPSAVGSSSTVEGLPHALRTPLEQPLFLLGIVFILIVVFLPGGLVGLTAHGRLTGLRRMDAAVRPEVEGT